MSKTKNVNYCIGYGTARTCIVWSQQLMMDRTQFQHASHHWKDDAPDELVMGWPSKWTPVVA